MIEYAQADSTKVFHEGEGACGARWLAEFIGRSFVGILFLGGICFLVAVVSGGGAGGYVTPVMAMLVCAALSVLFQRLRVDWDMSVLAYLEQAVRLNLPIPPLLAAAEEGERPAIRRRLQKLRRKIENGEPIGRALQAATPSLPIRIQGLVAAGDRSGRLATALRRVVKPPSSRPRHALASVIFLRWYPVVLFVFTGGAIILAQTIVMPKFRYILHDFGIEPPASMQLLNACAEWMMPIVAAVAVLMFLQFCSRIMSRIFSGKALNPGFFRWPGDLLMWYLPIGRGVTRSRAFSDVCDVLADALEAGRTLEWALLEASEIPINLVLQRRLKAWAMEVASGTPTGDAARRAGMPAFIVGMIGTSQATGNLPEVLRFLARYYDGRFSRAAQLLRGAAVPALAISFGLVVLVIAQGLFMPMIALINKMSPNMRVL